MTVLSLQSTKNERQPMTTLGGTWISMSDSPPPQITSLSTLSLHQAVSASVINIG